MSIRNEVLFIYKKDEKVVVLTHEQANIERLHKKVWKHTSTIKSATFIRHLIDNINNEKELIRNVKNLIE